MFAKRVYRVIMVVALAALVLPMASHSAQAQAKKVLKYDNGGEPDTLDPQVMAYAGDVAFADALFRGLLRYDKNNQPSPSIAKEVPTVANGDVSKDGMTYTYKLRNDWKWSDGNGVVKASDFVYAFQRLVNPKTASGYGYLLSGLVVNADTINGTDASKVDQKLLDTLGITAVDDVTLQVKLVHPASYMNQIASLWVGDAVRKDNVERAGDPTTGAWLDPANGPVVGSGPFTITKWDHNGQIVFSKNPNFAGGSVGVDEIDFPLIQDPAVAFAAFKSGGLDVSALPTAELNSIKADPVLGKELEIYPSSCSFYLAFDNTKPPFNNPDARKAFSYAIDRDTYDKVIGQGLLQPWYSFMIPAIPGSDPNLGKDFAFNADQAKAELAKAGYPNGQGFPTVSYHYRSSVNAQRTADWLQAQFKKVLGVTINEDPMDQSVFQSDTTQAKTKLDGMFRLGWCADYLHASDWLTLVFNSNGDTGNANDVAGYRNDQFDKLTLQADQASDDATALKLYQQAQALLVADQPVAFMDINVNDVLVNPRVTNLPQSALDGGAPGSYWWEEVTVSS